MQTDEPLPVFTPRISVSKLLFLYRSNIPNLALITTYFSILIYLHLKLFEMCFCHEIQDEWTHE